MGKDWLSQNKDKWGIIILLFLGLIISPFAGIYITSIMIFIGIYTIFSTGFILILGYADQLVLCANAFMGIGAYTSGILTTKYSIHPLFALMIAAVMTGSIAYLLGKTLLQLKGLFLGMTTLAFALVFFYFATEQIGLTGGSAGLPGIPYISLGGITLDTDLKYIYFVWPTAMGSIAVALNLVNSRFGQTLRAIGSNETAAMTLGIDAVKYKNQALVLHAIFSSVAGSLYAHYLTFIDPDVFFFNLLLMVSAMVILGGMYSVWGGPLGAAIIVLLSQFLRELMTDITGTASAEYELLIYGLIIIVVMMRFTHGLAPALRSIFTWLRPSHHRNT